MMELCILEAQKSEQKQMCILLLWIEKIFEIMSPFVACFIHCKVVILCDPRQNCILVKDGADMQRSRSGPHSHPLYYRHNTLTDTCLCFITPRNC